MTMTILTAYNQQVQKWTAPPVKSKKMIRLTTFMAKFEGIFEAVFTDAKKAVLDEILYLTSNSGIATITGKRLKEKTGYGMTTIRAAVKALKESEQFIVAQTANGRAGAYIFIDKEHENYPLIMKDLFDIDIEPIFFETESELLSEHHNEGLSEHLQNAETLATTDVVDEKEDPISFNSFNSIKKDLKPKQELASNLYGQVCKEMNVVGKDESVTAIMRTIEKAKKDIDGLTDDIALDAVKEAVHNKANDVAAYAYKVIKNLMNPQQSRTSHSKPVLQVDESKLPSWFKDKTHKQHVDEIASNEQAINFAEEVRKINAQYKD